MRWFSSGLPTMRLILIVLMIVVAALGALFGALNGDRVPIDFHFFRIDVPLGAALLAALLAGWLLGGLVAWIGHVPRLRRELRAARQELHTAPPDAQTRERAGTNWRCSFCCYRSRRSRAGCSAAGAASAPPASA
jgi:uncharacterized integral membrane protein